MLGDVATDPAHIERIRTSESANRELLSTVTSERNTGDGLELDSSDWESSCVTVLPIDLWAVLKFCDVIEVYDCFAKQGARIVGFPTTEYDHSESKSALWEAFGIPVEWYLQ